MSISKKWIATASVIVIGLGGCGMFGSNPVEGKWKVVSVTSNEHLGFGIGSMFGSTLGSKIDGKVYKFTSDRMTVGSASLPVSKYVIKKNSVKIYIKGPHGVEQIIKGTISNHDKDMNLKIGMISIQLQKIS